MPQGLSVWGQYQRIAVVSERRWERQRFKGTSYAVGEDSSLHSEWHGEPSDGVSTHLEQHDEVLDVIVRVGEGATLDLDSTLTFLRAGVPRPHTSSDVHQFEFFCRHCPRTQPNALVDQLARQRFARYLVLTVEQVVCDGVT
ncbi:hypothetical protein D3C85_860190 [compost metagenome]